MKKAILAWLLAGCLPVVAHADPKIGFDDGQGMDAQGFINTAQQNSSNGGGIMKVGYVVAQDPAAGRPAKPLEWVSLQGGKFAMGTDNGSGDAKPVHQVNVPSFEMAKTLVTVGQYRECVVKRQCERPDSGGYCTWTDEPGQREQHPVNCVDFAQASAYAKFVGGRLPSEAEYEYAATSEGKNQKYPWGMAEATCDKAVMYGNGGVGCGANGTMPVCSKTAGNTKQGLCDMSGEVWEWTQDWYHNSYAGAPTDGSAWETPAGSYRVIRGGSFSSYGAGDLRADYRYGGAPGDRSDDVGFRPVRSSR